MEDTIYRFALAARLNRMKFGDAQIIGQDDAHRAWPPTGDHDRSFEGTFHALALMAGGHRPETSYTTQERIQRDLDDTFNVGQRAEGDWVIHRRLSACPQCRGSGFVRRQLESAAADWSPSAEISADMMVCDTVVEKCRHEA